MASIPGIPGSPNTPPSSGNNPGTPDMPWSSGDRPNWSITPGESAKDIENQYETLVQWLQSHPKDMYNGGLALLQFTLEVGKIIGQGGAQASALSSFMNIQMTSGGNSTLMAMIIQMAAEGDAVKNGQAHADNFISQLAAELSGMAGFGNTFASMSQEASYLSWGNGSVLNSWIKSAQHTYTDPVTGLSETYWINPQTGDAMKNFNFDDWANAAAFPLGVLINSSSSTDYINSMYQNQIDQIFANTKNPWERMMQLLALVEGRMNDLGTQMNGLSGNLGSLSKANQDVADMQNMLKNPTAANMQQFYKDFSDLKSLIGTDPMLASLVPNLDSVEGIFNGNTAAFPGATLAAKGTYQLTANQVVEFTPAGSSTPEYLEYDGNGHIFTSKSPDMSNATSTDSTDGIYTSTTGGTVATPYTPWNVSAGAYSLPQGVVVEYTPTGATQPVYMEWNGSQIETSKSPNMASPIISDGDSTDGTVYLSGGSMTISPMDNPTLTGGLNFGQLQGLGDYQDIAGALTAAQTNFANPTSSNNANTITSLQTYFNSIAQPTQQQYSTDSSNYQTEESAFAQFLQAPITQEQQMTTAMQSAGN